MEHHRTITSGTQSEVIPLNARVDNSHVRLVPGFSVLEMIPSTMAEVADFFSSSECSSYAPHSKDEGISKDSAKLAAMNSSIVSSNAGDVFSVRAMA